MPTERQTLMVRRVSVEAVGVVSLDLVDPGGRALSPWSAGSHVDVLLPSGLVRSYSLCGDPVDSSTYRIAVLRAENGRGGSAELHLEATAGSRLDVSRPRNTFPLGVHPHYLFLAGGIGVTPLLSMVRNATRSGTPWTFVYGGRSRGNMAFLDELGALPGGRLEIVPQDEQGLPDLEAILRAAPQDTAVYCCGPSVMLDAVVAAGQVVRPELPIRLERFSNQAARHRDDDAAFEVTLARTGCTLAVTRGTSILEAVRTVLPNVSSSCEEGVCSACETAVLAGIPDHRDAVLTPKEQVANDYMMICVSRSRSPRLVLDL
jgi:ferredoxin-NADP reductase